MEITSQQKFQNMIMVIGMTNYGNNTNEYSVLLTMVWCYIKQYKGRLSMSLDDEMI